MKHLLLSLLLATSAFAEVKTETIAVPMRDGIKLATDIYRDDAVTKAPVVLMRTPYDRTKAKGTAEKFAKAGYVAMIQDCRGTRASEGIMAPYNNEGQDGYDTIEWITRQPWCSGRVGMMGGSYVGAVQWQAAVENPPGLAAIAPQATWSSFYRNIYLGGSVRLALISGSIAGNTAKPEGVKPADMSEVSLNFHRQRPAVLVSQPARDCWNIDPALNAASGEKVAQVVVGNSRNPKLRACPGKRPLGTL